MAPSLVRVPPLAPCREGGSGYDIETRFGAVVAMIRVLRDSLSGCIGWVIGWP